MNDETTTTETTAQGRQLSRRSVVRSAANAAWAVPLVQVAAAAPAMAASGDILAVTSATGVWTGGQNNRMDASIAVKNNSASNQTTNLQVTVTFPNIYVWQSTGGGQNRTITISRVSTGWGAPSISYSGSGAGRTATAVFTATAQVAAGLTSALGFRVTSSGNQANGKPDTVNVLATATGFTQGSRAFNPAP